jgi:hypothetical protein
MHVSCHNVDIFEQRISYSTMFRHHLSDTTRGGSAVRILKMILYIQGQMQFTSLYCLHRYIYHIASSLSIFPSSALCGCVLQRVAVGESGRDLVYSHMY